MIISLVTANIALSKGGDIKYIEIRYSEYDFLKSY